MDYFEFETLVEDEGNDKYLILIIYDISDNIRIYKLHGYGEVTVLGDQNYVNGDDVIII